jgi:DNA-binding response OmpR family regulator
MRVLLVEDDSRLAEALADVLGARGHAPSQVRRGEDALLRHHSADLVLLDLGLPDMDGIEVLRRLRRVSAVPVVVMTARDDERSVVRSLRSGADDYLVKPVRLAELLARMEAVSRRGAGRGEPPERVQVDGDVVIDLAARTVDVAGRPVSLTAKEFDVLAVLARRAGVAVSRQQLMDEVWGDAFLTISRTLDVHITALRAKLDRAGLIRTIRGFGYRLGT